MLRIWRGGDVGGVSLIHRLAQTFFDVVAKFGHCRITFFPWRDHRGVEGIGEGALFQSPPLFSLQSVSFAPLFSPLPRRRTPRGARRLRPYCGSFVAAPFYFIFFPRWVPARRANHQRRCRRVFFPKVGIRPSLSAPQRAFDSSVGIRNAAWATPGKFFVFFPPPLDGGETERRAALLFCPQNCTKQTNTLTKRVFFVEK